MEEAKKQIDAFCIAKTSSGLVLDQFKRSSKERSALYEYAQKCGLYTKGTADKCVILQHVPFAVEEVKLSEPLIRFFALQENLYLPSYCPTEFDYYMDLWEKVRPACKSKYGIFIEQVKSMGGLHLYQHHVHRSRDLTVEYLRKQAKQYQDKLLATGDSISAKSSNIFCKQNVGKWFISFDVAQANFQALARVCPELFNGRKTWSSFLREELHITDPYLLENKLFRQQVIGELQVQRLINQILQVDFISPILTLLDSKFGESNRAVISTDEVIYRLDSPATAAVCKIVDPDLWHIRTFRLDCVSEKRNYYAKTYSDQTQELKCVQVIHTMQAIRRLLRQEVTALDLRFMAVTGEPACFVEPTSF